jgi:hypothetical protein
MNPLFLQLTQDQYECLPTPPELSVQAVLGHYFCIFGVFLLPILINGKPHRHPVVVMNNLAPQAIIGTDFFNELNAKIDLATKETFQSNNSTHLLFLHDARSTKWIMWKSEGTNLGIVDSEALQL